MEREDGEIEKEKKNHCVPSKVMKLVFKWIEQLETKHRAPQIQSRKASVTQMRKKDGTKANALGILGTSAAVIKCLQGIFMW